MPAVPKRHRRERAKARSGLVGLHTVCPSHRGRIPPDRDRTGTHPTMHSVPGRHCPPASGRPDLRRRLQKRALAAVAQAPPPGTLTRGGSRWSDPPRTSTIRPAGPPTRTCSTRRRTKSPRSSTACCTPIHDVFGEGSCLSPEAFGSHGVRNVQRASYRCRGRNDRWCVRWTGLYLAILPIQEITAALPPPGEDGFR